MTDTAHAAGSTARSATWPVSCTSHSTRDRAQGGDVHGQIEHVAFEKPPGDLEKQLHVLIADGIVAIEIEGEVEVRISELRTLSPDELVEIPFVEQPVSIGVESLLPEGDRPDVVVECSKRRRGDELVR